MKATVFKRVPDETVVEVDLPCQTVIQRLQQMQGTCRSTDSSGDDLCFFCDKKGRFRIDDPLSRYSRRHIYRSYYIRGEVTEENGKTLVKFHTVQRRDSAFALGIVLAGDLVVLLLCLKLSFTSKEGILLLGLMAFLSISTLLSFRKKQTARHADTETMRQEVCNRLKAIERWDS